MNESGRLQGVAGRLVGQASRGEAAQLVVDQRQELASGVRDALADCVQQLRDFGNAKHLGLSSLPYGEILLRMEGSVRTGTGKPAENRLETVYDMRTHNRIGLGFQAGPGVRCRTRNAACRCALRSHRPTHRTTR